VTTLRLAVFNHFLIALISGLHFACRSGIKKSVCPFLSRRFFAFFETL